MTLQMLKSLIPRDNPKQFMLFYSSLFTTVTNLGFKYCFFHCFYFKGSEISSLKYLRAIHVVVAGGEKVSCGCSRVNQSVTKRDITILGNIDCVIVIGNMIFV